MSKVKELTEQTTILLVFTGFEAISIANCWFWLEISGFWSYSDRNLATFYRDFSSAELPTRLKVDSAEPTFSLNWESDKNENIKNVVSKPFTSFENK